MPAAAPAGTPWTPVTEADRDAVLHQMERLLNSRYFRNSKRYPVLLEYLVRETIAGNADSLKERTVGMAVFGRPANYDANADPVVRVTAGEIRKRIAQFYQEEGLDGKIQIDLRPGSYVPEFYPIVSSDIGIRIPESPSPQVETTVLIAEKVATENRSAWKIPALAIGISLLAVSVLLVFLFNWRTEQAQRTQMWSPLLDSPAPVLLVVGQPHAAQLDIHPVDSVYQLNAASELYIPDAIAMAHLCTMLDAHHHIYQIAAVSSTTLSDLRKGPAVLVGAFNNPWTPRLLSSLRFSLNSVGESDGTTSPQMLQIVDRNHQPGSPWTMDLQQPISAITHDYAIIARFQSDMTDGLVMVVAGLGSGGTESASKFVTSTAAMSQLAATAPRNWQKMNMEAVLETEVIGGRAGHTRVIATEFW